MLAPLMAGSLLVIVTVAIVLAYRFVREWSDDHDVPDRTAILDRLDPHRHTVKRSM